MLMSVPSVSSEEGRQTPSQSHLMQDEKSEVGEVDDEVTSGDSRQVREKVEEKSSITVSSDI